MYEPVIERSLQGHKDSITSISFNPSLKLRYRKEGPASEQLASASLEGKLTIWKLNGCSSNECSEKKTSALSLVKCSCKDIRAFSFEGHTGPIHHVSYSPSGELLASCSSDATIRLWTPTVNTKSIVLKGHNGPVRGIDFSRSESLMVSCSDDKTLKIWSLPQCTIQKSLFHVNWVRACRFSQDPNLCASGSDDGTVRLWDLEQGENVVTYTIERSDEAKIKTAYPGVVGVEFQSNYLIGAASTDGYVRIYDLRRDKVIQVLSSYGTPTKETIAHDGGSCGISFHPDGNSLLISSHDPEYREVSLFSLWDVRYQRPLHRFRHEEKTRPPCSNRAVPVPIKFSADGTRFSSGCADGTVLVWKNANDPSIQRAISRATSSNAVKGRTDSAVETDPNPKQINPISCEYVAKDVLPKWNDSNTLETNPPICTASASLSQSLSQIFGQLSLITQTIKLIERRVTILEESISKNIGHQKTFLNLTS